MKRFLFLVFLCAFFVSPSFSQGSRKDDIILTNISGVAHVVPNAKIRVCTATATGSPCSPLANIFSDLALTQALPNPITADKDGNYFFYAAPGSYVLQVSGFGIATYTLNDQLLPINPSSTVFSNLTVVGLLTTGVFVNSGIVPISGPTPDVSGGNQFKTNNVSPTTITNFVNGFNAQVINVICGDPNTTFANNATISLFNNANFSCAQNQALAFLFDSSQAKWVQIGGAGSGTTPTGVTGDYQIKTSLNTLGAGHINESGGIISVTLPLNLTSDLTVGGNSSFFGPNPYFDLLRYGGYIANILSPQTMTCSISSGSTTLSCTSNPDFKNGHGVVVPFAGSLPTDIPAAPAVLAVTPIGVINGSTQYEYEFVLENYSGAFTAAGASGQTTVGAATLGVNTVSVSSRSRVTSLTTYQCVGNCNISVGSQVQASGFSGGGISVNNGSFVVNTTPTATTFTGIESGRLDESESASATVSVKACNMVFPAGSLLIESKILRTWIYRRDGGVGNFNLKGVSPGQDPFFIDCNQGVQAPSYIPLTAPAVSQPGYLATTIVNGGGTNTMTLASAAGTTATSQTVQHDNSSALKAAYAAALAAHGGIVKIPVIPNNNVATPQVFPFNATTDFTTISNPTNSAVIVEVPGASLTQPWIPARGMEFDGIPQTNSPAFQYSPSGVIAGTAHPLMLVNHFSSSAITIKRIAFVVGSIGQSSFVSDQNTGSGGQTGLVFEDDVFQGNAASAVVIKGGFDFWFTRGTYSVGGAEANQWFAHPAIEFTNATTYLNSTATQVPGRIYFSHPFVSGGIGIQYDNIPASTQAANFTGGAANLFVDSMLHESNAASPIRVYLPNQASNYGIYLTDIVMSDQVNGLRQPLLEMTGTTNMNNIEIRNSKGTGANVAIGGGGSFAGPTCSNNLLAGCGQSPNFNLQGAVSNVDGGVFNAINGGSIGYAMPIPPAPASCVVSSGGNVPVTTGLTFAIAWTDRSPITLSPYAGITTIGPVCTVNTTSGNQTVTVTRPSPPAGATGWIPFRGTTAGSSAEANIPGSCSLPIPIATTTFVDTFAFTCGTSQPPYNTALQTGINSGGLNATSINLGGKSVTGIQGTDTNILTSGMVSGTGTPLCTDANGGATTSGCPAGGTFYQTVIKDGTSQTQRSAIEFVTGSNMTITCSDSSSPSKTSCTFTSSATSATAFSAITAATNTDTGNFITSGQWDFSAGSVKVKVSAGYAPTTSGLIGYDSTANKWVFGQNGSTVGFGLSSSVCGSNQFVNVPATSTAVAVCAQPTFTNISGTIATGQQPSTTVNSVVNDTNVTGSISAQVLTLGWTGILAKTRTLATTVYTDQANTWSTGAQDFSAATSLTAPIAASLAPTTNGQFGYDSTNNKWVFGQSAATVSFGIASATAACPANQFVNSRATATAAAACAQPSFSNISGNVSLTSQVSGVLPAGNGGTGEGGTITGIPKANGTSAFTLAVNTDVTSLFTGTCNSTTFLRGDGTCNAPAGGGNVSATSLTTNKLPKASGATTLVDSCASDDGTTFSVSCTGGVSVSSSAAGFFGIGQGTAQSVVANTIGLTGPTSITGYNLVFPSAAGSGFISWSNSSNIVTSAFRTITATSPVAIANGDGTGGNPSITCSTCAVTTGTLAQFSSTTSAQLASLISDETGTAGSLVFSNNPTIVTPTIASFVNATHNHQNAAGGGTLDGAAIVSGTLSILAGYTFTPGTVTSGHLACYTSSGVVGNCTGLSSVLGVFTSSTTWTASGEVSVALDATVNVTFGDNLCASSTSFGTAHDNGTIACTTGLGIGIVKTTASSVSSTTAFLALR